MRRISGWFLTTVTAVVLLFGYHTSTSGPTALAPTVITSSTGSSPSSSTASSTNATGPGGASSTVTGSVVQTRWGPVQVTVATDGGAIGDVQVIQYPNSNSRDLQISNYALPILIDETVKAQSADVDMVSGATYTSTGYLQSLQSALDQAGL